MTTLRTLALGGLVATVSMIDPAIPLSAQSPRPTFEVASVKLNKSGEVGSLGMRTEGTRFTATNVTARQLMMQAFQLRQEAELVAGPSWIDNDRFDIVARLERPGLAVYPMVRTLLADRFKLVSHQETRELPMYALGVARSDGRLGPKLNPSTCSAGRRPQEIPPCRDVAFDRDRGSLRVAGSRSISWRRCCRRLYNAT